MTRVACRAGAREAPFQRVFTERPLQNDAFKYIEQTRNTQEGCDNRDAVHSQRQSQEEDEANGAGWMEGWGRRPRSSGREGIEAASQRLGGREYPIGAGLRIGG